MLPHWPVGRDPTTPPSPACRSECQPTGGSCPAIGAWSVTCSLRWSSTGWGSTWVSMCSCRRLSGSWTVFIPFRSIVVSSGGFITIVAIYEHSACRSTWIACLWTGLFYVGCACRLTPCTLFTSALLCLPWACFPLTWSTICLAFFSRCFEPATSLSRTPSGSAIWLAKRCLPCSCVGGSFS